jgi:fibronectin-binding autotransporter adhesin
LQRERYQLGADTLHHRVIAELLNYSGLALNASAGSLCGGGLPMSGGPLAQSTSDSASMTFVACVPGTTTIFATASGTNATIGGPATQGSASAATINVFCGNGSWCSTSGSLWSLSGNWTDANDVQAAPGTFAAFAASDTAAFCGAGAVTTISVSGANPSLAALVFSGSNYTLTDGTLTLANGGGMPVIVVSDSTTQTISSTIAGSQGLLKDGPGKLVLSGTNSYLGDTTVADGRLIVTSSYAILDGTDLTIGEAEYFAPVAPSSAGLSGGLPAAVIALSPPCPSRVR